MHSRVRGAMMTRRGEAACRQGEVRHCVTCRRYRPLCKRLLCNHQVMSTIPLPPPPPPILARAPRLNISSVFDENWSWGSVGLRSGEVPKHLTT